MLYKLLSCRPIKAKFIDQIEQSSNSSKRKYKSYSQNVDTKFVPTGSRPPMALNLIPVHLATVVILLLITTLYIDNSQQIKHNHHHRLLQKHKLATRSLITNHHHHHQQKNLNSSTVDRIAAELETEHPNSNTTPGACAPPISQQQQENGQQQQHQQPDYRLLSGYTQTQVSNFVRPMFYTLRLKVDPTKRKFTGQLMITMEVSEPTSSGKSTNSRQERHTHFSSSSSSDETSSPNNQASNGHRYLTLHAGSGIQVKRAFYVYTTRGSIQIPATKIGHDMRNELLTIDFHPNVITAGQGLLLIVYSGLVNDTESHGLFVHHSLRPNKRIQEAAKLLSNGIGNILATAAAASGGPQGQNNSSSGSGSGGGSGSNKTITIIDDYGLATHMQPSFARRLFPSWDEPHLKARFSLIVVLPFRGYQTLSNMPVQRKSFSLSCSGEPMQEIEFHTTPLMSTYLLTLVIGRFDYLESITPNNCRVRVYFYANHTSALLLPSSQGNNNLSFEQQQKLKQLQISNDNQAINHKRQAASLALNVAIKTIDRLETLLGVKYPLSKFDMIAMRDFNSGGMENWGASIFNENYILLYDSPQMVINQSHGNGTGSGSSSSSSSSSGNSSGSSDIQVNGGKSRPKWMVVPLVVAHEIAHQWFGNLITSHSWTYLWLNEGFAQLLMYDLADYLYPEYNYWDMFIEDSRQSAMHDDELLTLSHNLEPEVYSTKPMDAQNGSFAGAVDELSLFDEITYNKGALVVRSVYFLLGRKQFFAGLQHYLLKHSYDIVRSHDLWLALEEANGLPDGQLEMLMKCWLKQEGYPLISVTIFEEPNHWRLRLSQSRFTLLPLDEIPVSLNNNNKNITTTAGADDSTASAAEDPIWALPVAISSELNPSPQASELQLTNLRRPTTNGGYTNIRSPLNVSLPFSANSASSFLFADRSTTILLPKASTGSWLKLNFNATGHHRVDYQMRLNKDGSQQQQQQMQLQPRNQVDMLNRMIPAIKDRSMCVIDRLNLVDDLFAMVKSGKKPTAYFLNFIWQAYDEEVEPIVLRSIVDSLKRTKAIVSNGSWRLNFLYDRYVLKYLNKVGRTIGSRSKAPTSATMTTSSSASASNAASDGFSGAAELTAEIGSNNSGPLGASTIVDTNQRQKRKLQKLQLQNINQLKEIEDLIEASRVRFNDTEFHQRAALLFNRNFRYNQHTPMTQPSANGGGGGGGQFESMDREMRAAIYSGALVMIGGPRSEANDGNESSSSGDLGPVEGSDAAAAASFGLNDRLPVGGGFRQNVTANLVGSNNAAADNSSSSSSSSSSGDPIDGSHSWLSSIFAHHQSAEVASASSSNNGNSSQPASISSRSQQQLPTTTTTTTTTTTAASQQLDSIYKRLLKAYETSDSSGERYAICSSLGTINDHNKQVKLLHLTLYDNYFRLQDAQHLLDSMARTKSGRQLMWDQFKNNIKTIERRQLLTPFLKSLSHGGLIELQANTLNGVDDFNGQNINNSNNNNNIETQLRNLYQTYSKDYGKVLSLTLELLLINSKWFRRDQDGLLQYLELNHMSHLAI